MTPTTENMTSMRPMINGQFGAWMMSLVFWTPTWMSAAVVIGMMGPAVGQDEPASMTRMMVRLLASVLVPNT